MWFDALRGSAFTVRQVLPSDVDTIVRGMDLQTFVDHFDPHASRGDAVKEAMGVCEYSRNVVTIAAERPIYVLGAIPLQGRPQARALLYGFPGRDMKRFAPAIARWFRRVYLPQLREIGLLPVVTAMHSNPGNLRWLEAAGAVHQTIEGSNVLSWES